MICPSMQKSFHYVRTPIQIRISGSDHLGRSGKMWGWVYPFAHFIRTWSLQRWAMETPVGAPAMGSAPMMC